ncbi:transmembrane protein 267-like [Saccostrea echinata]|uniref:transmembrane protein 267-like n=1 Tax=Saccostrea echinata TaxID=191078 RepID=UPI002A83B0AF|nr:transmembrane protein 267-like [Saccostrea echinata]XP_061165570.1 transmembrane protein 267-like [Saccostrea echinata]
MLGHVILYELALLFTCLLGDFLPSTVKSTHGNLPRALIDSFTHWGVAFFSWAIIVQAKNYKEFVECLLCGLLAMAIDADHFIAARSLSLQAALSLKSRPFLHSTTLTLLISLIIFITGYILNKGWIKLLSVMCFIAWTSHHIRDGSRRGLWFSPVGSTPAIPYNIYVVLTLSLPLLVTFLLKIFNADFMRSDVHRELFVEAKSKNVLPI